MKTKILIIIEGGCIDAIHSDKKLEVTVIDEDNRNVGNPHVLHPHVALTYTSELEEMTRILSQ